MSTRMQGCENIVETVLTCLILYIIYNLCERVCVSVWCVMPHSEPSTPQSFTFCLLTTCGSLHYSSPVVKEAPLEMPTLEIETAPYQRAANPTTARAVPPIDCEALRKAHRGKEALPAGAMSRSQVSWACL